MAAISREAFDRGYLLLFNISDRRHARTRGHAVYVNCARAALGYAATILRSGQADCVAEDPKQGRVPIDVYRITLAVYDEREGAHRSPPKSESELRKRDYTP